MEGSSLAAPWGSQKHQTLLVLLSGHEDIFLKCNISLKISFCFVNNQNTSLQSQPRQLKYPMEMLQCRPFSAKNFLQRALIRELSNSFVQRLNAVRN